MNWYKHIPMQRKILAACLVVILVPLTILVSLILRRSMDEEIDRSTVNMTQANEMIDDRLETIVNHLKTTSAMYLVYPDIIQFVKNDFNMDRPEYITTLRELRKNVMSAKINPYVSSITYLSNGNNAYSGAGYNETYMKRIESFAGTMKAEKIKNMLSPVYETVINQQSVKTITYGFSLVDTYTFEPVGYAFINLDLKQFGQSFMVFTEDGSMDTMAVQGDYVIYQGPRVTDAMAAGVRQALSEKKEEFAANKNQVMDLSLSGEDWRLVATYNEALDLTIISMAAGRVLKLHMMQGMASYIIIVVIMTAVFIGVSILLSVKLTRPIRVLEEGMDSLASLRLKLKEVFSDELVDRLLPAGQTKFLEREGRLYVTTGGWTPSGGEIRRSWSTVSDTRLVCRVSVADGGERDLAAGERAYDLLYEKLGGHWLFTEFAPAP